MKHGIEEFVKNSQLDIEELDLGKDFDDAAKHTKL